MAVLRVVSAIFVFAIATSAFAKASHKKVDVNYDDPNMAFTSDYASDTAATCPKTLKGKKLRECLIRNGFAASEEISESTETSPGAPPSSFH